MARALTAKSVEAAQADAGRRREVPDGALPGLYLVVQPSGKKSWALRYRRGKRPAKHTVGPYPAFGLREAREAAQRALRLIERGIDPTAEKLAAKAATEAAEREAEAARRDKVAALVDAYHKRHLANLRTGDAARGFLNRSAVAAWGDRDVKTITKRDVVDLLDKIVDGGSPIAANRTLAHLRAFFGWLKSRDVIDASPAEGVRPPVAERSRDRILNDDEIASLWRATERMNAPFGPLYRLLLLTGARLREAAGMTDAEIAADVWVIGANRTKNSEAHTVPLSAAAQAVLAGVPRVRGDAGYLFSTNGRSPVSGFAKGKARLDALMAEDAEDPIPPFVIHDLRRTAASGMARLGIAPHVVEAVLNHRSGIVSGVARVYNRFSYDAEKRAALEAWGRHVLAITGEAPADNVLVRGC